MKLFDEFKAFVMRGNVVDMAVGVIIGGAFGKIVTSLVNDIFMPIIGVLIGNVNFSDLQIKLGEPLEGAEQAAIKYGMFIQEVVNFLINIYVKYLLNGFLQNILNYLNFLMNILKIDLILLQ